MITDHNMPRMVPPDGTAHVAPPATKAHHDPVKRTMLVATSGQDGTAALRAAELLAARDSSDVVVLSVIEPNTMPAYAPQLGFLSPERDTVRAEARLAAVAQQLEQLHNVPGGGPAWPIEIQLGAAPDAIVEEARRRKVSLIIMDSGRHDAIARLLTGETTLRTIRRAECPVLAVGGAFNALPRVGVAAIDFSPSSIVAARAALGLLADGATLHLVHVWSRSGSNHPSELTRDEAYERKLPGMFDRVEEVLHALRSITLHPISLLGTPVEEILQFATSQGADLIAAGRRGHGIFERLLVGSVTTALVRSAPCSMLVTPEPGPADADELARSVMGVFESGTSNDWAIRLEGFSRRNLGRRTILEVDDPHVGKQMQASGYSLLGATYDHNDRRVQFMLGDPANETVHLTHTIGDVTAVAVRSDANGRDEALRVTHGDGQAVLRFLPSGAQHGELRAR
ncbi:MAG TPA: universal stress protein [Gemmatimonadaceae bacterium]